MGVASLPWPSCRHATTTPDGEPHAGREQDLPANAWWVHLDSNQGPLQYQSGSEGLPRSAQGDPASHRQSQETIWFPGKLPGRFPPESRRGPTNTQRTPRIWVGCSLEVAACAPDRRHSRPRRLLPVGSGSWSVLLLVHCGNTCKQIGDGEVQLLLSLSTKSGLGRDPERWTAAHAALSRVGRSVPATLRAPSPRRPPAA